MIVEVKKPLTKAKIEKLLQKLSTNKSTKKPFKASLFCGRIKWGGDAPDIQNQMRDEWE